MTRVATVIATHLIAAWLLSVFVVVLRGNVAAAASIALALVVAWVVLADHRPEPEMVVRVAMPSAAVCEDPLDEDRVAADLDLIDDMLDRGRIDEARRELHRLIDLVDGRDEAAATDARWARFVSHGAGPRATGSGASDGAAVAASPCSLGGTGRAA